jgi:hypothetical protein
VFRRSNAKAMVLLLQTVTAGAFGPFLFYCQCNGPRGPPLASAMTRTDCPLYGDLTKLNDGALEFAFDLCQRRQHLPEYAEAFKLIQEEDARRWNDGGKAQFQAMLIREFGDRAIQL